MCGIAGYIGDRPLDAARVAEALAKLGRRGPDHAGHERFVTPAGKHVELLHTRLSIIDLDPRSNQPFRVGPLCVVFNGELYNYVELKEELEKKGAEFRTSSDTEVLLHTMLALGDGALDRCEGMWAFATYDARDGSLILSRDRFGEKPLYLYRDETGLYFASEIKALMALSGRRFRVDLDHVRRYLVNGYKALYKRPGGFFIGVEELEAASTLRISADGTERRARYWEPRSAVERDMTWEEAVAGTRARLIESVELRLRADVPLAFCMSGGIDSNSLISIARRELDYDVHGFTILNADARYEEAELVELAVRELGVRHTKVLPTTTEFLPKLRELIRYHDAPVYTMSYYVHWLLMQHINENGYRISISGTASDELFSGYYDHHLLYLHEVHGDAALHAASLAAWEKHVKPLVRNPFLSNPRLFVDDPSFRDHIYLDAEAFARHLTTPWSEPFSESRFDGAGLLHLRMLNELFYEAIPVILHEDDLNAMYYSIENRSPFLDRRLFEHAFATPPKHAVRDGAAKAVLRAAMRGIVPDAILDSRRKVGFNASILALLDVHDPLVREEVLRRGPIYDVVRREAIEALLDKGFLNDQENKFLFYFLSSKLFLEELGG